MLKRLKKRLAKKEERKQALGKRADETEDVAELRSITAEIDELNDEITELRGMIEAAEKEEVKEEEKEWKSEKRSDDTEDDGEKREIGKFYLGSGKFKSEEDEKRAETEETYEKRGQDLRDRKPVLFTMDEMPELRAVNITGGTLVVPKNYSPTLHAAPNQISGLIDAVNAISLPGGNSYTKGFEVAHGTANYTAETANYEEADPTFSYVDILKAKITAYTEITDEAKKLPNVNYQAYAAAAVGKALRRKITREIIAGLGGSNKLTGIFEAPANVIPTNTDLEIEEIDADTLDTIVYSYRGDEDVEGDNWLILTKADLAAFAAVRATDGKKLYQITLNGNTGTISSDGSYQVKFILNSVCPALSDEATEADDYCMAYGKPLLYEMPIFSPVEIAESSDFKFRSGQIAFRGVVWAGGNVASYKAFMRVKKGY